MARTRIATALIFGAALASSLVGQVDAADLAGRLGATINARDLTFASAAEERVVGYVGAAADITRMPDDASLVALALGFTLALVLPILVLLLTRCGRGREQARLAARMVERAEEHAPTADLLRRPRNGCGLERAGRRALDPCLL